MKPIVQVVRHLLMKDGKMYGHFETDMIFRDGTPLLVFEWTSTPHGEAPSLSVELDPKFLHHLGWNPAKFLYEQPVEYPGPTEKLIEQIPPEAR
jgi:hypothetical protein